MRGFWRVVLVWAAVLCLVISADDDDEPGAGDDGAEQDALTVEQMRGIHSKIDKNGDGKFSLEEVMEYSGDIRKHIAKRDISAVLDEMDADKDGKLSLAELMKDMDQWGEGGGDDDKKEAEMRKELETAKFKAADGNGDALLDINELPALFYPETHQGTLDLVTKSTLRQKDLDGDGFLTPKEFWEGDADGEDLAVSEEENLDFKKMDTNGDGKLDLEELKVWESGRFHTEEAMKKLIEIADTNNDMHVTVAELEAAREQVVATDAHYHFMEWAEHHEL